MARSASEPRSASDPRRSASTPEASGSLIAAAERLFAARGIDGVSLREINREAQQRNTTSLQYHFGDREGLLRAIMAKHGREIDARRNALLDQYEANRTPGHPGAGVGVHPAARGQAARPRRRPGLPAHRRRAGQPQQPGDRADRAVDPQRPRRPRTRATASPAGARWSGRCCRPGSSARRCTAGTRRCASPTSSSAGGPARGRTRATGCSPATSSTCWCRSSSPTSPRRRGRCSRSASSNGPPVARRAAAAAAAKP